LALAGSELTWAYVILGHGKAHYRRTNSEATSINSKKASNGDCWALVPIKERAACKMRLAPTLSTRGRLRLARALLHHVINALRDAPGIDHIALVSPERDDVPIDILLLAHERQDINQDLTQALSEVLARGASSVVIVPADLPLLDPGDITALLDMMKHSGLAHPTGTSSARTPSPSNCPRL
jgi:2-phospho-L-lactate guanylyltransferase (CobY/MobA/RfbA family)